MILINKKVEEGSDKKKSPPQDGLSYVYGLPFTVYGYANRKPHSFTSSRSIIKGYHKKMYFTTERNESILKVMYCSTEQKRAILNVMDCPTEQKEGILNVMYCPTEQKRGILNVIYCPTERKEGILYVMDCPSVTQTFVFNRIRCV